jgi:hypothetical protein
VPVDEPSTPSNRWHHPLFNPGCVQLHSRGMLWPPTKAPDKCRGSGGEQALARRPSSVSLASMVRLHLSAMMDTAMMVVAVVKAFQPARCAGKGLG